MRQTHLLTLKYSIKAFFSKRLFFSINRIFLGAYHPFNKYIRIEYVANAYL